MAGKFLDELKIHRTPLLEGDLVTFVWRGRKAPELVGDFTGWDDNIHVVLENTEPGIWTFQHRFELDAYIEYAFKLREDSLPDPFNPRLTPNGIGGFNNYFSMPDYKPSPLSKKKRDIPHGTLRTHYLPTDYLISGTRRAVHLYQPPVNEAVPLAVVWDGQDYLDRIHLNFIVDNLLNQGKIRPIALACIDNAGQDLRALEYTCNDSTLIFLINEVLPLANRELNLLNIEANPGAYGVLGASMGGLMSLFTGLRLPNVFGNVLSQSGAFTLGEFDTIVFDLVNLGPARNLSIWLDVGLYDLTGLLECNRRMRDLMSSLGYKFTYHEYHAGHNYPAWRDDLESGLVALFGI